MQKTQPIRNTKDIRRQKQYYLDRNLVRNYALITLGMNTSLRIGDLLLLKWENVIVTINIWKSLNRKQARIPGSL